MALDDSKNPHTAGYHMKLDEIVNDAVFPVPSGAGMVVVKDIVVFSTCEHHMLPIIGKAHIGYMPDGKVLGLSKFARIADMFSRRLQVQERLTYQIADAIERAISPKGVAVIIDAGHMCMSSRGVNKHGASTITSTFLGSFESDAALRAEFQSFLK